MGSMYFSIKQNFNLKIHVCAHVRYIQFRMDHLDPARKPRTDKGLRIQASWILPGSGVDLFTIWFGATCRGGRGV